MVRIYLIDDHEVVRQALAEMLDAEPDLTVVGHAGDSQAAFEILETTPCDIVVVDLKLPGVSGLEVIRQVVARYPGTGVVVFTMYDNPAYVFEATQRGANAYVLKSASKGDLLRAVRAVQGGGAFLQAEITRPLLERLARQARSASDNGLITPREMQVLELLAEGRSNKDIARRLSISDATVKGHLKNLYDKLGASDRAHAVAIALRQQLID